jgi:hypothetical protein
MTERRYYLIDCLGRSVRPSGYTSQRGAFIAAKRRESALWALYYANEATTDDNMLWQIKYCLAEDML